MTVITDLINDSGEDPVPDPDRFRHWAETTIQTLQPAHPADKPVSLSIRLVDSNESAALNQRFRNKDYATNVLSFGCELPDMMLAQMEELPLGDLVICAAVVDREAQAQNKAVEAHWAHMVVHGILHLSGYDHIDDEDARQMETQEIRILAQLGFDNPYLAQ
jgi:probable rRNA maturation factor